MIGTPWLPPHKDHDGDLCIQQPGHVPHRIGRYNRRCNYCRRVFVAVVIPVLPITRDKCGGGDDRLRLHWLWHYEPDREPVA